MKSISYSTLDVISELPNNIVENILIFMPIRDAVRTSILARKWRYNWAQLPHLVFEDTFIPKISLMRAKEILVIINQVLLLHSGPITKFTLSISQLKSSPQIDQMLLFLSRNGIREFTLHICRGEHHKLPTCLYSCLSLRHLDLRSCIFQPPSTFKGFNRLVRLVFKEVIFPADIFGSLISSCRLLECLTLEDSTSFDSLDIDAPNLRYFYFKGTLSSICFKNTPLLAVLSMNSDADFDKIMKKRKPPNLTKVLGCLSLLENLHLGYFFVKLLAVDYVPKRISATLYNLRILGFSDICFGQKDEISCMLCLIKISPNLHKLEIEVYNDDSTEEESVLQFLEKQEYSVFTLDKLRQVHMQFFSGSSPELEFTKLLFAKSPVLEKMHIVREADSTEVASQRYKILNDIARFPRASSKAELIYVDDSQP